MMLFLENLFFLKNISYMYVWTAMVILHACFLLQTSYHMYILCQIFAPSKTFF